MNPATYSCEIGKYLASIMDDSAITWNEVIESYNIAILNFKNADFCCIITGIRKSKAIKLLPNIDWKKRGKL